MSAFTVSYVTFLYLFLMPVCRNLTKIPVPEMSAFAGSCVTFSYLFLVPVCQKFQLLTKATFLKQGTVHLDKFSSDRYLDDSGLSRFLKYLENKNSFFLDEFYLFLNLYFLHSFFSTAVNAQTIRRIRFILLLRLCDSVAPLGLILRTSVKKQIYFIIYYVFKTFLFLTIVLQ